MGERRKKGIDEVPNNSKRRRLPGTFIVNSNGCVEAQGGQKKQEEMARKIKGR